MKLTPHCMKRLGFKFVKEEHHNVEYWFNEDMSLAYKTPYKTPPEGRDLINTLIARGKQEGRDELENELKQLLHIR